MQAHYINMVGQLVQLRCLWQFHLLLIHPRSTRLEN